MSYENRSLLDLAHRGEECQIQLPGVCIGYSGHGCEPAHANQAIFGKGGAMKAGDQFHAAGCHPCHVELDQGRLFSREAKQHAWLTGFVRTWDLYWSNGWLKVKK